MAQVSHTHAVNFSLHADEWILILSRTHLSLFVQTSRLTTVIKISKKMPHKFIYLFIYLFCIFYGDRILKKP